MRGEEYSISPNASFSQCLSELQVIVRHTSRLPSPDMAATTPRSQSPPGPPFLQHHASAFSLPVASGPVDAPGPSSPLPELLRAYQQALAAEQQASDTIQELHREIAELVELQLNLQKLCHKSLSPSSGRSPSDVSDYTRSLALSQIQASPPAPAPLCQIKSLPFFSAC